ncbi:hypothetical protein [Mesorhizobium sp. WSM2239]|uniref:Uncharacterized protein n=2 Tax=unclassified Mesorhizobium TaxID=325217 RepID=A0AAU8DDP4_9HYPH
MVKHIPSGFGQYPNFAFIIPLGQKDVPAFNGRVESADSRQYITRRRCIPPRPCIDPSNSLQEQARGGRPQTLNRKEFRGDLHWMTRDEALVNDSFPRRATIQPFDHHPQHFLRTPLITIASSDQRDIGSFRSSTKALYLNRTLSCFSREAGDDLCDSPVDFVFVHDVSLEIIPYSFNPAPENSRDPHDDPIRAISVENSKRPFNSDTQTGTILVSSSLP